MGDFNDPQSITSWVQSFRPLYSFQQEDAEGHDAEQYFRFIHLAMEMVHSRHAPQVFDLLRCGDLPSTREALKLQLETERRMNNVFKTLPRGSAPRLYNSHVRPFIAGTWGGNCGTVFDRRGKYF